ncbi:thioredoxin family protein [Nitrospirillum sp. BR 11164]|uniref:thioredoxin family protein n=1 Tax=Nitrospirillum sp. BR 11164 TaxID=3104324 RepID=UPI002AFFAA81|nr:thioredoxin family protein [Nitrospirillum sp. BR 11164]MEA1650118.1 thioredoxin family protein [Nitrospirillum sp. BR 11164]
MRPLLIALSLAVAPLMVPMPTRAGDAAPIAAEAFDPARDAAHDVAVAASQAKAQGKRVLVDVGGEWCVWCHRFDALFTDDARLRTLRDQGFVTVKVNWSKENKNEALLGQWPKMAGYPHLFVLDGEGKVLHSQDTGLLEQGKGYDTGKVAAFLTEWGAKAPGSRI